MGTRQATLMSFLRRQQHPLPVGLLVLVTLVLASCAVTPRAHHAAADRIDRHAASEYARGNTAVPAGQVQLTADAPSQAVALRSELERLLGAHMLLADELVRATLRSDPAQIAASQAAVDANRQQLATDVANVSGAAAAGAFGKAWEEHLQILVEYAAALRDHESAALPRLRTGFSFAERHLGAALGQVVGGTVPPSAIAGAVAAHYRHLLGQADAFAAGRYDKAYAVQRDGFAHMLMIADVLARGVAAHKQLPTAELDAPRRQLQSALSHLLAEHMGLMVQTMRAANDRTPDLPAAGRVLDANTKDLAGAINALYGAPAGQRFLTIWADHVDGLVHYAGLAAAQSSAAKQAETTKEIAAYAPVLARFLAGATGGKIPSVELASALNEHDQDLRSQVDAYAAMDKTKAQQMATHGYDHMFELSQSLATAIGDAVARRLPTGGVQTGGGAMAGRLPSAGSAR